MRNSSLVKWFRADNVTGLKHIAEAVALTCYFAVALASFGVGVVQVCGWVGERRTGGEAAG